MRERVLKVIEQALPQVDFSTSADLVDDGILDSLSIVTMISELSMEFGIEFDVEDLVPENLNSVDAITETVEKLLENK